MQTMEPAQLHDDILIRTGIPFLDIVKKPHHKPCFRFGIQRKNTSLCIQPEAALLVCTGKPGESGAPGGGIKTKKIIETLGMEKRKSIRAVPHTTVNIRVMCKEWERLGIGNPGNLRVRKAFMQRREDTRRP
jgi:hypothetical protein